MQLLKKDWVFVICLTLLAVVTHLEWFDFTNILRFGDWQYRPDEHVRQGLSAWSTWINFRDFGLPNIVLFGFPLRGVLWSLLSNIGLTYDTAVKFTLFIPIALGSFLSPYFLVRKLTKDRLISVIVSLFYASTTYFLILQTAHLPIAFVYAFFPLLVYLFDIALEKNTLRGWIVFALLFSIGIFYDVRIMYIVLVLLTLYFLFFTFIKKLSLRSYVPYFVLIFFVLVAVNFFWIVPSISGSAEAIVQTANRGLFGNNLFTLPQAFTISKWNWTGAEPDWNFIPQSIAAYLWIIPIIAFAGLLIQKKKYEKEILFFSLIALIGIFLTKQSSAPFSNAYLWLYENFPGFNLFRESSKFYLITAFGYLGLLSYTLLAIKEHVEKRKEIKWFFPATVAGVLLVAIINLTPLATKEMGSLFVESFIPPDYALLKNHILGRDGYFRTMWIPRDSPWAIYTENLPKISAVSVIAGRWNKFINYRESVTDLDRQRRIIDIFHNNFSDHLLDSASVKYALVPIRDVENRNDFFRYYGNDRDFYINELDGLDYLSRVNIGTEELVVYENKDYKPYFSAFESLSEFQTINSLEEKYSFVTDTLGQDFEFVLDDPTKIYPVQNILSPFINIRAEDIGTDRIIFTLKGNTTNALYIDQEHFFVQQSAPGNRIVISPIEDGATTSASTVLSPVSLSPRVEYELEYIEPGYEFINAISNFSFENGFWRPTVGDCNNYDNNRKLDMQLSSEEKTDGNQSLQLEATRHIACTSIDILVEAGETYFFSFDYQSPNAKQIAFYMGFDDFRTTVISERFRIPKNDEWQTYAREITAPEGASSVRLFVYSFATDGVKNIVTRYDNVHLVKLPRDLNNIWFVSNTGETFVEPRSVDFELLNPTKKLVSVKGATTPFYLAMSESYHDQWQAQFNNDKVNGFFHSWVPWVRPDVVPNEHHFELNGFLNGWFIDVDQYCQEQDLCTQNPDGTYDMELVIEFTPQRWFYLGLLISGTTFAGCVGYLVYALVRRKKRRVEPTPIPESEKPRV